MIEHFQKLATILKAGFLAVTFYFFLLALATLWATIAQASGLHEVVPDTCTSGSVECSSRTHNEGDYSDPMIFNADTGEYLCICGETGDPSSITNCECPDGGEPAFDPDAVGNYVMTWEDGTGGGACQFMSLGLCRISPHYRAEQAFYTLAAPIAAAASVEVGTGVATAITGNISDQLSDIGTLYIVCAIAGVYLIFYVIRRLINMIPDGWRNGRGT